jgi:hypothetical protein
MAKPNNGLITETNSQYYAGSQTFEGPLTDRITTTFNTDLEFGDWDPTTAGYNQNNFKLYISATGAPNTFIEYNTAFSVVGNTIILGVTPQPLNAIVVQLLTQYGGAYDDRYDFGDTV